MSCEKNKGDPGLPDPNGHLVVLTDLYSYAIAGTSISLRDLRKYRRTWLTIGNVDMVCIILDSHLCDRFLRIGEIVSVCTIVR